jgi:hypothetical protein
MPFNIHPYEVRKRAAQMTTSPTSRISQRKCEVFPRFCRKQKYLAVNATELYLAQIISEGVLQSFRRHVEGKCQRYTRRSPLRIPVHPHGKHFQGQQARLPPGNGSDFSLRWTASAISSPASSPQTNHGRCTPHFYSSWALNTLRGRSRVNSPCG